MERDRARGQAIRRLYRKAEEIAKDLNEAREDCSHPVMKHKYDGDTGNYDPSQDGYWITCYCQLCGKRWTINDDEPGYRTFCQDFPQSKEHDKWGREEWSCQMLTDDQLRQN